MTQNIGTTFEDGFGRIEWYIDLNTNSTFCIPEIAKTYQDFCDQIAQAAQTVASSLEETK